MNAVNVKLPQGVKPVRKQLASGKVVYYHYLETPSGRIPIEGERGSTLFYASYEAALRASADASAKEGDTLANLIKVFKASPEANAAKPSTLRARNYRLRRIEDRFGYMTLGDLQLDSACADFIEWRNSMRATPPEADACIQTLGQVLRWAKSPDGGKRIKINQTEDIGKLVTKREKLKRSRKRIQWTKEYREAFLAYASPVARQAFLLNSYLGCRASDLCRLEWRMIDKQGWLRFVPEKTETTTGAEVAIPTFELPPLRALLAELRGKGGPYLLRTVKGKPLRYDNLHDQCERARAKAVAAGFPIGHLHLHDMRGTAVQRMLDAGCSHAEVVSITGHAMDSPDLGIAVAPSLADYSDTSDELALSAYRKWTAKEFAGRILSFA